MNRRMFLGSAATAAVIATWPDWLRQAFAATAAQKASDLAVLSAGYRRAQRAGRPLLVLVIPAEDGAKYERGHAWGEYLNHGSAEQLAPLALCEVVCADMARLRRLVPTAGEGEPWLVLVETDQVPARVWQGSAALPEQPDGRWWVKEQQLKEDAIIEQRIGKLAELVRQAVQPDAAALLRRAAQARATLAGPAAAQIQMDLSSGAPVSPEQAAAAPAVVALAAERAQQARRTELIGKLADLAAARLLRAPVPGSHWARSEGCGTTVEGVQEQIMVACGMGHVPEKSARFLYFFTKVQDL